MSNDDMAQFLGVFLDEATEQLELLEQAILKLEHESTPELLQEIFRAAHTLKGSSRAMGFTNMGELTHAMEDVFDRLRNDDLQVDLAVVDLLFEALDMLKKLKEEITLTGLSASETDQLVCQIRNLLESNTQQPDIISNSPDNSSPGFIHSLLSTSGLTSAEDARKTGCRVTALTVDIARDCLMKSVRALMVMQSLETVGSILSTTPSEQALEDEDFEFTFGVILATNQSDQEIEQTVFATSEITGLRFSEVPAGAAGPIEDTPSLVDERIFDLGPESRGKEPSELDEILVKKSVSPVPTQNQTVRVDVTRLDSLLNLIGELVIDQTRIARLSAGLDSAGSNDSHIENLREAAAHFGRITGEMQEQIMKARMLPIDHVFNRFPRMMRDLSQKLNKEIDFVLWGRETELDRSVIEVIGDPLIHMLRNSVDHGIEVPEERLAAGKSSQGVVKLGARHEENYIIIEIEDDGRGIDPDKLRDSAVRKGFLTQESASRMSDKEALNLIFTSGFSTAKEVSDVSGRGVGMDIVKNNLTRFGAVLAVDSHVGVGSRFTIKLPLTLAIIRGLLVKVAAGVYAAPLASVQETLHIQEKQIHVVNHREVIIQRGMTLPLIRLQKLFYEELDDREMDIPSSNAWRYVVVVGALEHQVGLVVDSLLGEQEIVIKSLGKFIGDIKGISGATILGDGSIALILDVNGLQSIANEQKVGYNATRS